MTVKKAFYYSADYLLSEVTKRKFIDCFGKIPSFPFTSSKPTSQRRKAAVLVPLCESDGRMSLMYTLRSSDLKRHAGLVSFPGGLMDSTDKDLVETALRETEEETGLKRDKVTVWGTSECYLTTTESNLAVYPVLGFTANYDHHKLVHNPVEVETIFTMPLENLCDLKNIEIQSMEYNYGTYRIPKYLGGPKEIWGITALITDAYLRNMFPSDVYNSEEPSFTKRK